MVPETRDRTLLPIPTQCVPCAVATASGKTVGEHDGVSGAGARSGDALELEGFFLKQAVEHTPGESAVAAAALERQVHYSGFILLGVRQLGAVCLVERKSCALPLTV